MKVNDIFESRQLPTATSDAIVTIAAGRVEILKNFDAKRGSKVKIDKFAD